MFLLASAGLAGAQPEAGAPRARSDWWFAVDAGFARLSTDRTLADGGSRNGWGLNFSGGATLNRHLRLGLKLGGIGLEAGDLWDPSRGESFSQVFLVTEYSFQPDGAWFAHAGAGWSRYVNNDAEFLDWEGGGWGAELGIGYAVRAGARWHVVPLIWYTRGQISPRGEGLANLHYSAVGVSLGLAYR